MYKKNISTNRFLLYEILERKCKLQEKILKSTKKELIEKTLELSIAKKEILNLNKKLKNYKK